MADNEEDLLLRITAEDEAEDELAGLAAALAALDRVEANPDIEVEGLPGAMAELAGFAAACEALDDKEIKPDVDLTQLELFGKMLDSLNTRTFKGGFFKDIAGAFTQFAPHGEQLSLDVDVDTSEIATAQAEILGFAAACEAVDAQDINVDVDVDRRGTLGRVMGGLAALPSLFSNATEGASTLGGAAKGLWSGFESVLEPIKGVTVNIGSFGARMGPIVAIVLLLAGVIATTLVGAIALLGVAVAGAIVFIGGLAVALAGALLPAIGALIPVMLSFKKVLEVLQAQQQEEAKAAETAAQKHREAVQYNRQHADAVRALQEAIRSQNQTQQQTSQAIADAHSRERLSVQSLRDATVSAYQEMEDAIEDASDAQRSFQTAQLSLERANLGIEQANQNLKDFRKETGTAGKSLDGMFKKFTDVDFRGNMDDLISGVEDASGQDLDTDSELRMKDLVLSTKEAYDRKKQAIDGVSDAQRTANRAEEKAADFRKNGIGASDTYTAALRAVRDARRDVTRAEVTGAEREAAALRSVQEARRNVKRIETDRGAQIQQDNLTKSKQLTDNLSDSQLTLLGSVKRLWAAFQDAFGPSTDALVSGIASGLDALTPVLRNMKGPLTLLGQALGGAITAFATLLATPEMQNLFSQLIAGATALAPLIGTVFGELFKILLNIAVAAMPFLVAAMKAFGDFLKGFEDTHGIEFFAFLFDKMEPLFSTLLDLALVLGEALLDFLIAVAPYAEDFVKAITDLAEQFVIWLSSDKGQAELRYFFETVIPLALQLIEAAKNIFFFFLRLTEALGPAFGVVLDLFNVLMDVVNTAILMGGVFTNAAGRIFGGFTGALDDVVSAVTGFIDEMTLAGADIIDGLIDGISGAASSVWNAIKGFFDDLWTSITGWWGIASPSTKMLQLGKDIIQGLINGIASLAGAVWDKIRGLFNFNIGPILTKFYNFGRRVVNKVLGGVEAVADKVRGALRGIWRIAIGPIVTRFFNFGKRIVNSVIRGVRAVYNAVWGAIKRVFTLTIGPIATRFYNFGRRVVNRVISGVKSLVSTAWNTLKSIFNIDISGPISKFYEFGKNIVQGFINGVKSLAGSAVDSVKNIAKDAWSGAKGILGIGSPSKVFYGIGVDVGKGFELGVKSTAGRIQSGLQSPLRAPSVAAAGGGGAGIHIAKQDVHLPPAPGHDQLGDPRVQAMQFARELRRRGQSSIGGGGVPA